MALQIYLPLNGDTKNYGLASNVTITTNNIAFNANGKIGQCGQFNGSDSFISINSQALNNCFKGGSQAVSIAFWIKHSDTNRAIIFGDYGLTGAIGFNLELKASSTSDWRWYWNGSPDQSLGSNVAPADGNWHHCAIVYTGTKLRAYKDGVLVGSELTLTLSSKTKSSGAWYVGRDNRTGATAFSGNLNDFRIYDNALSDSEIAYLAGNKKHKELLVWMPLISDLHNQGILNPTITITGTSAGFTADGKIGAHAFSTNTTVTINTNYTFTKNWSICFWAKPLSSNITANWTYCFYANDGGSRVRCEFCPTSYSGGGLCFSWNNNTSYNTWTGGMGPSTGAQWYNKWTHCILTGDAEHVTLYLNGNQVAQGTATDSSKILTGQFVITNGDKINLNDLRIYNYTLTLSEIKKLAQGAMTHQQLNNLIGLTTLYDGFGYQNNSSLNSYVNASNTPRYAHAASLNKVKLSLLTGFPVGSDPDFTICFWAKILSSQTYTSYQDLVAMIDQVANNEGNPCRLEICGSPVGNNFMWFRGFTGQSSGGINMNSSSNDGWWSKNNWHFIALTGSSTKTYKCYFDGIETQSYTNSSNTWAPTGKFAINDTIGGTVEYSDIRVFATTLTADEIMNLYKMGHVA